MDNTGGAVVIEVASEAEGERAIATSDPAVQKGVFVFELHPWKAGAVGESILKKPPGPAAARDGQRDGH